jgi:hypothetical protein
MVRVNDIQADLALALAPGTTTIAEISVGVMVDGELRQASVEVTVPHDTSWSVAENLARALGTAHARLWSVPANIVHVSVTLVRVSRVLLRHGDVHMTER